MTNSPTQLFISVIVPIYNEEQSIPTLVASFDKLEMNKHDEVIFVNDGSLDDSLSLLNSFVENRPDKFKLVTLASNTGRAGAINAGIAVATGDVLAFTDADAQPAHDWLKAIRRWFAHHKTVAAGGAFAPSNPNVGLVNWYYLGDRVLNEVLCKKLTANKLSGVNSAVRRSALQSIGDFNCEAWWADDSDLCFRLNKIGNIYFDTQVFVTTIYPATPGAIWNRKWIWGQAMGLLFRKKGIPEPRLLIRPVALTTLICVLLSLPFLKTKELLGAISIAAILDIVISIYIWLQSKRTIPFLNCIAVVPFLILRELPYLGGFFDGLLRGDAVRNRSSWKPMNRLAHLQNKSSGK